MLLLLALLATASPPEAAFIVSLRAVVFVGPVADAIPTSQGWEAPGGVRADGATCTRLWDLDGVRLAARCVYPTVADAS